MNGKEHLTSSFFFALCNNLNALELDEKLNDRVRMAQDYVNIGNVPANIKNRKAAIELFSKALEILEEFEEKTGYHHPLIDLVKEGVSVLE